MSSNSKKWGIDLSGRKMKYRPWPISIKNYYRQPSDDEIKEIYGISGEAVSETLLYFEECGGDTKLLIELLNDHIIDNHFIINRDILLDETRWYTNEYYFYFIMFTKKVMNDYNWRFTKGENVQLSIHHKIYEIGYLRYSPYGDDEKDDTYSVLYAVIKYYKKHNYDFSPFFDWAESLSKHKTSISFKDVVSELENYWLCSEFNNILYEFVKVILNKNNFTTICFEGFDEYDLEGFSYVPESMLIKMLSFITRKTTNFYDMKIENNKNSAKFILNISEKYNRDKDDIYRSAVYQGANSVTIGAFPQIIKKLLSLDKMPEIKNLSGLDSESCTFTLEWEKRLLSIPFLNLFICNFLAAVFVFLNYFFKFDFFIPIISFILPLNAFLIVLRKFRLERRKRKISEENLIRGNEENRKSHKKLVDLTNELMMEKHDLEDNVKERTKELADANEKLKELDKMKTNFFANISHELRTPLTLIISPLNEIIKGSYGKSLDKNMHIFNAMMRNGKRLLKLINSILDFTKIEEGRMNINYEKINISESLKIYISQIESAAEAKKLYLKFIDKTNGIISLIDQNLFEIAVFNILSNALKFTEKGGITIKLEKIKNNYKISFSDTGIGIPDNKKDEIFDRFHQIDENTNRKYEGTGIGLALTKEIIKLLNGKIELISNPGEGSTFIIILPINKKFDSEKTSPIKVNTVNSNILAEFTPVVDKNYKKNEPIIPNIKTVLIVEDNKDLQKYICSILENDYNLEIADNGNEAFKKLKIIKKPSIIISDIMMPGMDGIEFYNKIQEIEEYKNIPFIFLTALADEKEKIKGLKSGAIDYIAKPFNIDELKMKIKNIIVKSENIKKSYKTEIHKKILNLLNEESDDREINEMMVEIKLKNYNLTKRENEIAFLVAKGYVTKEIAHKLNIKTHSVENYITSIYKKTGITNRIELFQLLNLSDN